MGEYATLYGHARRLGRTGVVAQEMKSYLQNIFPGLTTASREDDKFKGCDFNFRTISPDGVKELRGNSNCNELTED